MPSPAICMKSADTPNGILQIKDLAPSRSQASAVYDPAPQGPRYIRQPVNALPKQTNGVLDAEVSGLSAYILANTDRGNDETLNQNEAFTASESILGIMRSGGALTFDILNLAVKGATGNPDAEIVDAGNGRICSGRVDDILAILAGAEYVLPVGYRYEDINNGHLVPIVNADYFNEGQYLRVDEEDSSFWISLEQGDLSKAKSNRIDPNTGLTLDPLVVVYDGNGNVL